MMNLASIPALRLIPALIVPVLLGGCADDSWLFAKSWDGYPENQREPTEQAEPMIRPPAYGGPGAVAPESRRTALSNTHWRLAEIQETGDRISRPDDPAKYTFTFGADGVVLMTLNCNRARGPWSAQTNQMGQNALSIGPLETTNDMCEPPSLDEQIAHDMEYVRSFFIEGNRLYLDLMLGGGTYVLEQIGEPGDRRS